MEPLCCSAPGLETITTYLISVDGHASSLPIRFNGDTEEFIESLVRVVDGDWRGFPPFSMYGSVAPGVSHLVIVQRGNKDKWLGENARVEGIYGAFIICLFIDRTGTPLVPTPCTHEEMENSVATLKWVLQIAKEDKDIKSE